MEFLLIDSRSMLFLFTVFFSKVQFILMYRVVHRNYY